MFSVFAIGILDIAYTEKVPRIQYTRNDFCVGIAGFHITKLGAWLLGITQQYKVTPEVAALVNDEGSLQVLPDYSIVILGLKCRIKHETYLSKFLTSVSNDENAAVYRLDFPSVVRAHDIGLTPQATKAYLKKVNPIPLPENIERSLNDWQQKIGRIKFSTVTILEADDPLLLAEIKHIRGIDKPTISDLQPGIIIEEKQQKKAKALIEKNGWLVKLAQHKEP